jgi:type I restriction enzyme R subunit
MTTITESDIEKAALDWFAELGYTVLHGPEIAPGASDAERSTYKEVVLTRRFEDAVARLNPNIPPEAREEAIRKVHHPDSSALVQNNRAFHLMMVNGIAVDARQPDGTIRGEHVRLVDFENPENNHWLAVNQFTVQEHSERRPDIVLFINGLPLAVIELKNPTDEKATVWTAFRQLRTYKQEIPTLFTYNEVLVISDGLAARIGSLTADREWFMPWRTIEGEGEAPSTELELEVLIKGIFEKGRFLNYLKHFIVFEGTEGETIAKKIAGYHQFHATISYIQT